MSSIYNDDDDDDIKKVVALRGDFMDWIWLYWCVHVRLCVCVLPWLFFYSCVAFNSIIQWCISQIYGTNTHTCACIHIHWDTHTHTVINVHPGRNIFICAAASMTIIACFCCIIITRVLWKIMWSQKKVHNSCLWIWYANSRIGWIHTIKSRLLNINIHKTHPICPTFFYFT